jgi:hypothetical protein
VKRRRCAACREPLPTWARIDKLTCGPACRTRLYRQRLHARDAFVTGCRAVAARSGAEWGNEPAGDLESAPEAGCYSGQLTIWLVGRVRP